MSDNIDWTTVDFFEEHIIGRVGNEALYEMFISAEASATVFSVPFDKNIRKVILLSGVLYSDYQNREISFPMSGDGTIRAFYELSSKVISIRIPEDYTPGNVYLTIRYVKNS